MIMLAVSVAAWRKANTRPHGSSGSAGRLTSSSLPVILDRAGSFEVLEQDRLDVEDQTDLVGDDHAAAGELVLP